MRNHRRCKLNLTRSVTGCSLPQRNVLTFLFPAVCIVKSKGSFATGRPVALQANKWLDDVSVKDDGQGMTAIRGIIGDARKVAEQTDDPQKAAKLREKAAECEALCNQLDDLIRQGAGDTRKVNILNNFYTSPVSRDLLSSYDPWRCFVLKGPARCKSTEGEAWWVEGDHEGRAGERCCGRVRRHQHCAQAIRLRRICTPKHPQQVGGSMERWTCLLCGSTYLLLWRCDPWEYLAFIARAVFVKALGHGTPLRSARWP